MTTYLRFLLISLMGILSIGCNRPASVFDKTFTLPSLSPSYTLNYSGNGETSGIAPANTPAELTAGESVTVLGNTGSLDKNGFLFAGWNTAADGSGTTYAPGATFTILSNTTLFAQWITNTFTVIYVGNGSTGGSAPTDSSSSYNHGTTVAVIGNSGALVRTGYIFAGWNTAPDGSGTSYAPNATFTITANTTLYAQWTINTYTIGYNANGSTGGSVPTDSSSPYNHGTTVTVLGNSGVLVRTGYTFAGWNTAANGTGTTYAPSATLTITANTTLYAQWTINTYTVGYNSNGATGGSVPTDSSSPYNHGTTVTVLGNSGALVRTGYAFAGWNTASDGSGTTYAPGATFTIATNTTLHAKWTINTYTIGYNDNSSTGGLAPNDTASPYNHGSTVAVLSNSGALVRTGYVFGGWNTAANGSGTSYAPSATFTITANTTLYAKWTINTYTVGYNSNGATGGSVPTDSSSPYNHGTTVTVLGNTGALTLTSKVFTGWNTAADGTGTTYAPSATFTITENKILYAQWAVARTVTYNTNSATSGTAPTDTNSPYASGATVTVLGNTGVLVRTNYIFSGWNTASNGSGTNYAASATLTISSNITLYAKWISTDSSLSGLTLSIGSFNPSFSSTTLSYSKSVTCDIGATTITPTASSPGATVEVRINAGSYASVTSASPSLVLSLVGGSTNPIDVRVTAQDGITQTTYTVSVTRAPADLTCNIIAFWHLDDSDGATSAVDSSTQNRPLDSVTGVTFGAIGKTGSAVTLSGTTSYLRNTTAVINTSAVTVAGWVYPTAYPSVGRARLAGLSNNGNNVGVYDKTLTLNPAGKPEFYVYCDGANAVFTAVPASALPLNQWSHVAGVVDGINVYLYLNGTRVSTTTCMSSYTGYTLANLMLGGKQSNADINQYFVGRLDEFGFWSRGLNDLEITNLMNSSFP